MTSKRFGPPRLTLQNSTVAAERGGIHVLRADAGRAWARLEAEPHRPPDADLIIALGNAAAAAAGGSVLAGPDGPAPVPPIQELSANLFRGGAHGDLTAEAELTYRGRTTLIVNVRVRDERDRLVAAMVVTQLAPATATEPSLRLAS